jgi:hypothetical protein
MNRTHGFRSQSGKLFPILAFWLIIAAIPLAFFVNKSRVAYQHAAGVTAQSLGYPVEDGNIYWVGDFETGDLSQWAGVHVGRAWGSDSSINVVTSPSPVRQGKYAAQLTVNTNPYGQSYDRAELTATRDNTGGYEGQEWYYSWSVYLPSNPDLTTGWPDWTNLMQWMDLYHNCSPPEALMIMSGYRNNPPSSNPFITFVNKPLDNQNGCATLAPHHQWDLGGVLYDQWIDFTLHIKWSADPTIGFLELWMNGKQVIAKQSMRTLDTSGGVYQEAQVYRGNNWTGTTIVYQDCVIRHDRYTSGTSPCVTSNSTSPTPTSTQVVTPTPTPLPTATDPPVPTLTPSPTVTPTPPPTATNTPVPTRVRCKVACHHTRKPRKHLPPATCPWRITGLASLRGCSLPARRR